MKAYWTQSCIQGTLKQAAAAPLACDSSATRPSALAAAHSAQLAEITGKALKTEAGEEDSRPTPRRPAREEACEEALNGSEDAAHRAPGQAAKAVDVHLGQKITDFV
eukprot:10662041-Heterocapsa_arctica.AAC.1